MIGEIGTFLGGLGQFAGGMGLGQSNSGISSDDIRESMKARLYSARHFGEMYGFHPLAALGVSPVNLPSQRVGGANFAAMGQGLNRMLNAGQSEITKAQIENIKADTRIKNKTADEIGSKAPEGQGKGIVETELPPPVNPAYEGKNAMENVYFHQKMNGERGLEFLPGQGAQDYLSESFVDNMKYRLQKETQGYKLSVSRLKSKTVTELRDWLDRLEMYYPPRKGWHYAWNFKSGRPIEIRNNKYGKPSLFDTKYMYTPRYGGFQQWRNKQMKGR